MLSGTTDAILEEFVMEKEKFTLHIRRTNKGFYFSIGTNSLEIKNKIYKRARIFLGKRIWAKSITRKDNSRSCTYKIKSRYYNYLSLFYLEVPPKEIYRALRKIIKQNENGMV